MTCVSENLEYRVPSPTTGGDMIDAEDKIDADADAPIGVSGHEARHPVGADDLAPSRLAEIAAGFDLCVLDLELELTRGLAAAFVLGLEAPVLAALPLTVGTVRNRGTMELRGGWRRAGNPPC